MTTVADGSAASVGDCLRAYALHQFDVAGRSLGLDGPKRHEGIHQARKAMRRIRAVMDLGRKRLWPKGAAIFDDLRSLCRRLSRVRDAHAAVETLDRLIKQSVGQSQRAVLKRARQGLLAQQSTALESLLASDPALRRCRARLSRLRELISALPWSEIDSEDIRRALARSERRAERAGNCARNTRHGPLRHRWRRRLRRLRHQMVAVEAEPDWPFVEGESRERRTLVSALELTDALRMPTDVLAEKSAALGFEHDLRILRLALRRTASIENPDRAQIFKFLRYEIAHAPKPPHP